MLRLTVLELAESFRSAVEIVVQTYFNTLEVGQFFYVCGMKEGASHAWLEVDGLIIDLTGNQFPGRPSIYVDTPDAWYGEWEQDIRHLAVHEPSALFYGEEHRFLGRVLQQLNRR